MIRRILLALAALTLLADALGAGPLAAQPATPAPLSLSDPDGQELVLESLDVRTAMHGPLALTELEIRFRNPHGRVMEGRFGAVLPEGATISRFAHEVNGELMEGEVVERLRANQVYDRILQTMRDPALLEQDQGNRFSARIFPIAANATVRVVLGYSQLVPVRGGERVYALPLRGLPRVGRFAFRGSFHPLPGEEPGRYLLAASRPGRAPGARVIDRIEDNFVPTEDLEVRWRASEAAAGVRVLTAGDYYVASLRATGPVRPAVARGGRWVFLLDTSASSAEAAEHRIRALERLLAALPAGDPVELRAFDHRVVPLRTGSAAAMARAVGPLLRARLFLGGTDLAAAVSDVATRAAARPGDRFVVVSDGVATLGRSTPAEIRQAMDRIPAGATVHALVLGARQDAPTLRALTQGRGRIVAVPFSETMDRRAAEAAARLALPTGADFAVTDAGAEWVLSSNASDVHAGDEVVAVARLRPGARPAPRFTRAGRTASATPGAVDVLPIGAFAPLLEREAMRAWLAELAEREARAPTDSARRALAAEQVRLSIEHRVMIPRTTMLVLETEDDYQRFGLDRRALSSVLTVGPEGIALLERRRETVAQKPIPQPVPRPRPRPIPPRPAPAGPGSVTGRVLDMRGAPLPGATVSIEGMSRRAVTGSDGTFRMENVPTGRLRLRATRVGYAGGVREVRVGTRVGASVDFRLAQSSVALEGLVVTGADGGAPQSAEARAVNPEDLSGTGEALSAGVREEEAGSDDLATMAPVPVVAPPAPMPSAPMPTSPPMPTPAPVEAPATPASPADAARLQSRAPGAPVAAPVQERPSRPSLPAWINPVRVSRATADSLAAALRAEPRRRELYNQLSEAQWALGDWTGLRETALAWQPYDPENPQVYEALGEAALRLGRREEAARAFASLVEVGAARPELLQRAGLLLLRAGAAELAVAPLRRSLEARPDRVNGHRHLALVLWQLEREDEAARVLEDATRQAFPQWYGNVQRVVREELGYVLRAWAAREPARRREIGRRAAAAGVELDRRDALRVTLAWETDANDVDLHVVDPKGNHVFYGNRTSPTGVELYEDITRGFGPEVVRTAETLPGSYHVGVKYFNAGPMGVSRGVLVVMQPDARGVARTVQILPFRLVEGGGDVRHLAEVVTK